ncbi:MAG: hypothetical protein C7B47_16825 [Sulfobacillus thermosulfidooxidans]|uniref:Uncharacterized protein n=1 Tax=Sulfobacillus thermosulfidooxidans TaxID=28034 RepID=A0A2T2WIW1_SULTH|nr:MAG: hypothetical protein C7B47_16825 [Sulfobacillus thermosulfidooxidans]
MAVPDGIMALALATAVGLCGLCLLSRVSVSIGAPIHHPPGHGIGGWVMTHGSFCLLLLVSAGWALLGNWLSWITNRTVSAPVVSSPETLE